MKKYRFFGVIIATLVVLTMGITGQATASGWSYMQGSAAAIQHPDRTNWWRGVTQGLDLDLKHGQTTLVHIGIQPPINIDGQSSANADKIMLFLYTGSDLKVTKVLIYSGAYPIQEVSGPFYKVSPYYFFQEIPFTNPYGYFPYGLGISLEITAGSNSSLDHRFCLGSAGAHWVAGSYIADSPFDAYGDPESETVHRETVHRPVSPPPPPYGLRRR
jgi:hypothetical protein